MSCLNHNSRPQRRIRSKQLPIELINCIITLLEEYTDDERARYRGRRLTRVATNALRACSLVCRAWNKICRPLICSSFTANLSLTAKLTFLHFTAPHLYEHITHLTIIPPRDVRDIPPWVREIWPHFGRLRALCLDNRSSARPFLSLPPLESGVTAMLAKVPLQRLCLEGWRFLGDIVDLRHILSLCSSTLEELALEDCHISDRETAPTPIDSTVPQGVRMEALRKLRLSHGESRLLGMPHIELPNLDSLFCEYTRNHYPAPCIPVTVSELAVKVSEGSTPPRFSPAIRLCTLTIDVSPTRRTSLYPSVVSWIRRCIDELPCPNHLRRLNIRIMNTSRIWLPEPCYPARADYESLYETLWPLHQDGALKHLDLTLEVNASKIASDRIVYPVYRTRAEVAIVKEVWGPVLEAGEVVVDLTFELTTSTRELVVLKYRL